MRNRGDVTSLSRTQRKTANWSSTLISPATLAKLLDLLAWRYDRENVRVAVLVKPVAVEHVIDNEADALETIRRLEAAAGGVK